ncbi:MULTISPECIES: DUF4261 domain-containing protein [Gordonia]|uniref:DUF4261 domain-containing protein n=1 Tax=Gordonia TaxID=2053 RepID=UPI0005EF8E97|nr:MULTISPECIES: DUF4261 domain-containing protein [Gordonia]KJR08945.1 hypothetical protein UG54_06080 [Gordonia sihwensis]KXT55613.1 hypothetical protein Y710_18400 [Gordonia sp. QH-12]
MDPLFVTLCQTRIDPGLTAARLLEQIRADWGELLDSEFDSVVVETQRGEGPESAPVFVISFDEVRVLVAGVDAPHGLDVADAAQSSPLWSAEAELPDPDGPSLVVAASSEAVLAGPVFDDAVLGDAVLGDDRDLIEEATLISRVVTSLLACTDSVRAVYMHTSEQIAEPSAYRRAALEVSPDLPLMLWVDFMVADEAGLVSAETIGMSELGLLDIEVTDSTLPAEQVVKVVVDTAVLMYDDGPVIGDGDVLGTDSGDFTARIAPSKYDADHIVLHLVPPTATANRAERRAAARKKKRR